MCRGAALPRSSLAAASGLWDTRQGAACHESEREGDSVCVFVCADVVGVQRWAMHQCQDAEATGTGVPRGF